ncbi:MULTISPECIES: dienelactone hydrolase family protein [Actinokineospora]|uniref:Dienelactone hydrolase n=1 Tax=Actinokineospora fastidiosa TaxID=1816 RepID=A0A918G8D1_9PSEU|nr:MULTISPECIES: alpha/beta hydrolase [Actinokineospora]UVS82115.1 putative dienelactone hydrolase [Actinokineospora sp. UTMC 2448]GGS23458.1 dienelactone hydrolase [Actinokineospora fastidiosa]
MARLLDELSRPGPYEVLRGDLALVGLPGAVFTPRTGLNLPAIAFGHGWLQPVERYRGLLRHLASWGIVTAAPATQSGPFASSRLLAADLRTALDVCVGVRLGDGDISVDPARLGLAGHSTGAGCAVLAAAEDPRVRAVATLAASQTRPFASEAARACAMPSLHLAGGRDIVAPPVAHAELIARTWAGPSRLCVLPKSSHMAFTEGRHWSDLIVQGKGDSTARKLARGLLTAFFLHHLAGVKDYAALLEEPIKGTLPTAA